VFDCQSCATTGAREAFPPEQRHQAQAALVRKHASGKVLPTTKSAVRFLNAQIIRRETSRYVQFEQAASIHRYPG